MERQKPLCPICGDTGWIEEDDGFSRLCECQEETVHEEPSAEMLGILDPTPTADERADIAMSQWED